MKNLMAMAIAVLGTASAAFAATATFTEWGPPLPGTPWQLDLWVSTTTLPNIDAVDLVIGWNEPQDLAFAYSAEFTAAMTTYLLNPPQYDFFGYYTNEVYVAGAKFGGIGANSIRVGTLTVQTAGLTPGFHTITISSVTDQNTSGVSFLGETEPVFGSAIIYPEPASLALVGLGALAALRRRRA
jgi:hypothetical protein